MTGFFSKIHSFSSFRLRGWLSCSPLSGFVAPPPSLALNGSYLCTSSLDPHTGTDLSALSISFCSSRNRIFAAASSTVPTLLVRHRPMSIMSKALHRVKFQEEKAAKAKAKALEKLYQPAGVNELMPKYLEPDQPKDAKALDIAVVGIPNAGKSTLVNRLVQKKISIVSPKVQTTRKQIQAVLTTGDTQLVWQAIYSSCMMLSKD